VAAKLGRWEYNMTKQEFIETAELTHTKNDVKRFVKAAEIKFGNSITEWRQNFGIVSNKRLYIFNGCECFYDLGIARK